MEWDLNKNVQNMHVRIICGTIVHMVNVKNIHCTSNSVQPDTDSPARGPGNEFDYLSGEKRNYAVNLMRDWRQQLLHINGLKRRTIEKQTGDIMRLLDFSKVAPWELTKKHVTEFLDDRYSISKSNELSPATVSSYCSSWRSLQNYILDPDRSNEIMRTFNVRPLVFVNEENGIAAKRYKANWKPKGWALTEDQIDAIDDTFRHLIQQAHRQGSKSFFPLIRDRVMFHVCIHFALRVSELVTIQMADFKRSHEPLMQHFGDFGTLTVTGKNQVTGTIPMRERETFALLEWYVKNIRQKFLLKPDVDGLDHSTCSFNDKEFLTGNLLFLSERKGVVSPQTFRDRLSQIAAASGVISRKLTPHTLRHTGCTLMVPLYSPEVAQKYMRHKGLHTTLYYYHPTVLDAGNEINGAIALFPDDDDE